MSWSAKQFICVDRFFGFHYTSTGGSISQTDCAKLQQKTVAKNINVPGKPYVTTMTVAEILAMADENGFISGVADKGSKQCAALVKAVLPILGSTKTWKSIEKITASNISSLMKGTAIGYGFDANGNYPSNKTGNHVAIFIEKINDKTMSVVDQWSASDTSYQKAKQVNANFISRDWYTFTVKT